MGWLTAQQVRSFHKKEPSMPEIELYNRDTDGYPAPSFATDAEIEFAEQLRHQLEERYLAPSAPSAPAAARSSEVN
jgi:hypothetical protein